MADMNQNSVFDPQQIPSPSSGFNFTSKTSLLWLKRETLQAMCVQNGLGSTGTKEQLADRLVRFYTEKEDESFPTLDDHTDEDEEDEGVEEDDLSENKFLQKSEISESKMLSYSEQDDMMDLNRSSQQAFSLSIPSPQPQAMPASFAMAPASAPMALSSSRTSTLSPMPPSPPPPQARYKARSAAPAAQSSQSSLAKQQDAPQPTLEKSKKSSLKLFRKDTKKKSEESKESRAEQAVSTSTSTTSSVITSPAARLKVVALCCEGSGEDSFNLLLKGKEAMSISQESPSAMLIELAKIKCPITTSSVDKDAILALISSADVVVPLLTKNSMTVEAFIFGIENAKKLHKRIILVHDKASCDFPSHKPESIKDVFDQIAVTLIGQYSTRCWEKIISRIQTSQSVKEEVDLEVFLSHRQKTGQGIALALYNEMQNRPSTENKVFLDVKAQFTLHDLELLVAHTKLFVFIVTKGIFTESAFCFIEFETAVRLKKWMVIVWDLDYKLPKDMLPMKWAPYQHILYDESITAIYNATYIEDCVNKILEVYHKHALKSMLEEHKGSPQMKQAEKVAKSSWSKLTPEKRKNHLKEHPLYAANAVEFSKMAQQSTPPPVYTEVILWKSLKKK